MVYRYFNRDTGAMQVKHARHAGLDRSENWTLVHDEPSALGEPEVASAAEPPPEQADDPLGES